MTSTIQITRSYLVKNQAISKHVEIRGTAGKAMTKVRSGFKTVCRDLLSYSPRPDPEFAFPPSSLPYIVDYGTETKGYGSRRSQDWRAQSLWRSSASTEIDASHSAEARHAVCIQHFTVQELANKTESYLYSHCSFCAPSLIARMSEMPKLSDWKRTSTLPTTSTISA
jgi:hypothetical protein